MTISTIGEAINAGWRVFASCDCGSVCEMERQTLLWRSGRGMPLALLKDRLRCPVCGERNVKVTWTLPSTPQPKEEGVNKPRYKVETYDTRGEVAELIGHVARFDQAVALFDETVRRRPGNRITARDGSRVVRQWPPRGT